MELGLLHRLYMAMYTSCFFLMYARLISLVCCVIEVQYHVIQCNNTELGKFFKI